MRYHICGENCGAALLRKCRTTEVQRQRASATGTLCILAARELCIVLSNLPYTEAATYNPVFCILLSKSGQGRTRNAPLRRLDCWNLLGLLRVRTYNRISQFSILEEPTE